MVNNSLLYKHRDKPTLKCKNFKFIKNQPKKPGVSDMKTFGFEKKARFLLWSKSPVPCLSSKKPVMKNGEPFFLFFSIEDPLLKARQMPITIFLRRFVFFSWTLCVKVMWLPHGITNTCLSFYQELIIKE